MIIGYGNIDRGDDGVAYAVVNALRRSRGLLPLGEEETGLEALGAETDTLFLSQLTPELVETLCPYDRIVFVDAHATTDLPEVHCQSVSADGAPALLLHHFTPGMLLGLLKILYGREPAALLLSVRGHDFDFRRGLSPKTQAWARQAAERLKAWLGEASRS